MLSIFLIGACVLARSGNARASVDVEGSIRAQIGKIFPKARIELAGTIHMAQGQIEEGEPVSILRVTPRGEAVFSSPTGNGWVSFSAWMPAKVALRRIQPGEKLSQEQFVVHDVNVSNGNAYEYRGVIVGKEMSVVGLEARQTVLAGQFLTTTAVQRVPDVRRGDSVRIRLVSGDLTISAMGSAQESAYVNGRVHVTASRTKRDFVGHLLPGGVVEVKL